MSPIVALRHLPVRGVEGICYGQHDWPADVSGIEEAVPSLREQLPHWPILSSPLQRCFRLASRLLAPEHGLLQTDNRLLELNFGEWEQRRWSSLDRGQLDAWSRDVVGFCPPGGESFGQLIERVAELVDGLTGPTILVTHAGVIRALLHIVAGWPAQQAAVEPVAFATPIPLSWNPQGVRRRS